MVDRNIQEINLEKLIAVQYENKTKSNFMYRPENESHSSADET